MARPKKSFKNLKLLQINIRVTLEEQIILEEFSKLYGVNVVEYIRIKTLKKQLPKRLKKKRKKLMIQTNQMTRKRKKNQRSHLKLLLRKK
jgi:superfamily I DNA and/or RNA helicase